MKYIILEGCNLSTANYNGQPEGTMFKADENGVYTGNRGMSDTVKYYRTYVQDGLKRFSMKFPAASAVAHMRYSIDDGSTWQNLPQGGGTTEKISFPTEGEKVVKFIVQIMDDKTFYENEQAGLDGFGAGDPNTFTFGVEQVPSAEHSADIISAEVDQGYLSPEYDPQITARDYHATVAAGEAAPVLTFEISPDATVKIDNQEQTPVEGTYNKYIFTIPEVVKRIEVISADGKLIEGINVNVGGNNRKLTSKDGKNYEITVGHRIGEVVINPVVNPQAALTINGEAKQGSYELTYGDNEFTIAATDANGNSETVKLVVKRDNPPASSGKKN